MISLNSIEMTLGVLGILGIVGGIAGIVGGTVVKRHRKAAGVLMLAGAAACFLTIFGPMLLITGGVLALVPAKTADGQAESETSHE
jgi:hypothetical protein